jgi:uncharacterized protein YdeI (YjbR/CyaY-like superfamily)
MATRKKPAPKKRASAPPIRPKPTAGKATAMDSDPVLFFATSAAFEAWLKKNHERSKGVWLQHAKKGASRMSVTYPEALDVSLCWGWIDGQKRSHDDETFLQRYSPRGRKSIWSAINREKVRALIDSGRMQPSGQRHVDAARADGRWENAYAPQRTVQVPADLQAALDEDRAASAFFRTLSGANRYAILHRVLTSHTAKTRAARIAKFVALCARGETVH